MLSAHRRGYGTPATGHDRKALDMEPDNATAHINLGNVLRSGGNLDEAGTALRVACRQLDKAASKGVIHKNQAANRKSAIAKRYAELAQAS